VNETPEERKLTLAQLVGDAHQQVLTAPRQKDGNDRAAMRLLEIAYARLQGRN
jgi:hypothetical protein